MNKVNNNLTKWIADKVFCFKSSHYYNVNNDTLIRISDHLPYVGHFNIYNEGVKNIILIFCNFDEARYNDIDILVNEMSSKYNIKTFHVNKNNAEDIALEVKNYLISQI